MTDDAAKLHAELEAARAEIGELRQAVVAICDIYNANRSEKQRVKAYRAVAAKALGPFSLAVVEDWLGQIEERDRDELKRCRGALKIALDGWAVWAYGSDHPERPDSITDAEIYDQAKIEELRRRYP